MGILCEDGVVMVADGAATYGLPSGNLSTIRQSTQKLVRISQRQMLGTSGAVALSQAFTDLIRAQSGVNPDQVVWTQDGIRNLANNTLFNQCVMPSANRANTIANLSGNRGFQVDATQHSVFACISSEGKPILAQITPTCQVEFADQNLPFISVGSGQVAADPFLAFLKDVFCKGSQINIRDAKFLAYWAVDLTIRVQPGMVSYPIQMMILHKRDGDWHVDELTDEVDGHAQMVQAIEDQMYAHRNVPSTACSNIPLPPHNPN